MDRDAADVITGSEHILELDQSDVSYPYRDTESVKAAVQAAQQEHLDDNGEVKDGHNEEVCWHSCNIIYDIVYDIVPREFSVEDAVAMRKKQVQESRAT